MCEYLKKLQTIPECYHEERDGRSGHDEKETNRQVCEIVVPESKYFANEFKKWRDVRHNDLDKCLKPLVTKLISIDRPTQASCCGHGGDPWLSVFVRTTKEDILKVLDIIYEFKPEWRDLHFRLGARSRFWVKECDDSDNCRFAIWFEFYQEKPKAKYCFDIEEEGKEETIKTDNFDQFVYLLNNNKGYF